MTRTTISKAHQRLVDRLSSSETPALEARVLLQYVLNRPAAWLLAHPEETLTPIQETELDKLARRLAGGEPLAYITGRQEFFGLEFTVTPHVLIPRPETELLVEQAIAWLAAHPDRRRAVDVGAGSGCIGVTLAVKTPGLHVTGTDISPEALAAARTNAIHHSVKERLAFVQADLLEGVSGPFDLLAANLPYIPGAALSSLEVYRHEPALALDGGEDGLRLIRRLLEQAVTRVSPGGILLLEIEASQGEAAAGLARAAFRRAEVRVLKDLSQRDRLVAIQLK